MAPAQEQGKFKIALVQMPIGSDKEQNLNTAARKVAEAKKNGAYLVLLPECFNSPYETGSFDKYAEEIPNGPSSVAMSKIAKDNGVYLVGGSIPEKSAGKLYNSCPVWDPNGKLIALHRKVHLFNMDIPGKCTFFESEAFTPGEGVTIFDVGLFKVGVAICYDLRFPEWAALYRDQGVSLMIYPGAFDTYTGPMHWDLLLRSRALDNQMYVAGVCGARDTNASYVSWGHSLLVDPWGRIVVEADEKETILYHTIDMKVCDEIRKQIPVNKQRRPDLYSSKKI
ncbi:Carbon-nitrogen hydrolase [Nesidiocoris tenuis]|uniref:omega-amidase n=1 Tax=Nesidiocoris tenuis TaxID=355587 RepID=A0ABN7B8M1_9HEMI|nr:Carbon-nitrogen hydrolase [Nesidiocoris tenuis]